MANTAQAKKRARQNKNRALHNMSLRTRVKSAVKKVLGSFQAGKKEEMKKDYQSTTATIDKMANKGIIHKNKAARLKSRLHKKLKNAK